ncbi:beta strand repeat-containing protein [Pararhodospirillum photometricum]|uniref:beta strand repeat-containing protein n=1 Tax=Pararhodospirillum photometricum TaxID=1084 RepID=UPI00138AD321|nr:Ig-like domain-containing protein [Pararhodospirillum photometricum]
MRGDEDTAVAVPLTVAPAGDGSTLVSVVVAGLPAGATLSAGTRNPDGTWTLSPDQLSGLTLTPGPNSDDDFTLTVSVTARDADGDTTTTTTAVPVTIEAVADAPEVVAPAAEGDEDTPIPLAIDVALTDLDGSESLTSVTITGVPTGASLSAGTQNPDGSWTLTPAQLAGLTITPPENSDVDFTLTVSATSVEAANGDRATTTIQVPVTVNAVADQVTVEVEGATTAEDAPIALTITTATPDTDGSETISLTISGLPTGATLSAGTLNPDGSYTLTPAELSGLTITPPVNSDVDFNLTVTATSQDGTSTANTTITVPVTVNAVADQVTVDAQNTTAAEDTTIPLTITTATPDTDGSETISLTISGLPTGATLSAGTLNPDGSYTLTPAQLTGLTLTPPADFSGTIDLTVVSTTTEAENGDFTTATDTLSVTVTPVADAPVLPAASAVGNEDTAIPLNLAPVLTDTDGSETLSITISNVPTGATLSAGTLNPDGSYTLTPAELSGLTITPPVNSDVDFNLTVTATSQDGTSTANTTITVPVTVNAVADQVAVDASAPASVAEDAPIALTITTATPDTDGSETISLTISGLPTGATLSAGTLNPDGSYTLTPAQLTGLTLTPPTDFSGTISLTVVSTTTEAENGDFTTATDTLNVTVTPVADAPKFPAASAVGNEDTAIPLNLAPVLTDTDGSETLSITISNVPTGATLSAGTLNPDGSYTLTPAQLSGLTITPPVNSDVDFNLTVTATSQDGTTTANTSITVPVTVNAVADQVTVDAQNTTAAEDTTIPLTITTATPDTDGSETISLTISGLPSGATLSAGTLNPDGSYTLTPAQLTGLTLTPPTDFSGTISLTVVSTTTEAENGDFTTATDTLNVTVTPVADAPVLPAASAVGNEDTAIPLNLAPVLTDTDGSETLSITISNVPTGATLSAGTLNPDGSYTLTPAELSGLTITPPVNSDVDFNLTVTATSQDGTTTANTSITVPVTVNAVADQVTVDAENTTAAEDTTIPLTITTATPDTDGSETISLTISGLPSGATLSAGTLNPDGSYTLTPAQLTGLTLTPPTDFSGTISLTVVSTTTEAENGDFTTATDTLNVTVTPVADAPKFPAASAVGNEDTDIPLNLAPTLVDTDGSETLVSITIGNVPSGATLSAGTLNPDGTYTLTPAQLTGLTIRPPVNSDVDFNLTVTATSQDGTTTANTTITVPVTVNAVADQVTVDAQNTTAAEDTTIPLTITTATPDTDGSETISLTISGLPSGATLSAGTPNADGSYTLTPAELSGLTLTPPANFSGTIDLTVVSTTTEAENGSFTTATDTLSVTVTPVADAPVLPAASAVGNEDTAIPLNLAPVLTDTDGSETLSITISNVPAGATLSAGTPNPDGSYTLTPAELSGLTITPPVNSDVDFNLTVTATSQDGTTTANTTITVPVTVIAVADQVTVDASAPASVAEDTPIPLTITTATPDTDGSETISLKISGLPTGATLSAGTPNADGSYTLTPAQLEGLTLTPPTNYSGTITLTVVSTTTEAENGRFKTATDTLSVTVTPVTDLPTLSVPAAASGVEDKSFLLNISAGLQDTDGSEILTVTISDIPKGASLVLGSTTVYSSSNTSGTLTLSTAQYPNLSTQLATLKMTAPSNFSGEYNLQVSATSQEKGTTDIQTLSGSLSVNVTPDADGVSVSSNSVVTNEDTTLTYQPVFTLKDKDGSESLDVSRVTITAADTETLNATWEVKLGDTWTKLSFVGGVLTIPASAVVVASRDSAGNPLTYTFQDVRVTPATDSDKDLDFTLKVYTDDQAVIDGNTATSTKVNTFSSKITVNAVTDEAKSNTLVAANVTGVEDHGNTGTNTFPLSLTFTEPDSDGSETLTKLVLKGVPADWTIEGATKVGDTWVVNNLSNLSTLAVTLDKHDSQFTPTTITAEATWIDANSDASNYAGKSPLISQTTSTTFTVAITPDADTPTLTVQAARGLEDTPIALDIRSALVDQDGSETLAIIISNVPPGAVLSVGTDNHDGTWTLTQSQLTGLTITPPKDSNVDFTLKVTAVATEGANGDQAQTAADLTVTVRGVADAPLGTSTKADGTEDQSQGIALNLLSKVSLADTDVGRAFASEELTAVIRGLPPGFTLSEGHFNADGSWALTASELSTVRLIAPKDYSGTVDLDITLVSTEVKDDNNTLGSGDVATAPPPMTLSVKVTPVVDQEGGFSGASGLEDSLIKLTLDPHPGDTDGSESWTGAVTLTGVPAGATILVADGHGGYDTVTANSDGAFVLTHAQAQNAYIQPPEDSNADFTLTVTTTITDSSSGGTATKEVTGPLTVTVTGVADDPTVVANDASGTTGAFIPLTITGGTGDADGSETVHYLISSPSTFVLSAGHNNGDGTWTLTQDELDSLSTGGVRLPTGGTAEFTVRAIAVENDGDTNLDATDRVITDTFTVTASGGPGGGTGGSGGSGGSSALTTLTVNEDTAGALGTSLASVAGTSGASLVVISGVPTGATLQGTYSDLGGGTIQVAAGDLAGLTITPPANSGDDFPLTVSYRDGSGSEIKAGSVAVDVVPVADAPTVTVASATGVTALTQTGNTSSSGTPLAGTEDTALTFTVDVDRVDDDGSELRYLVVENLPAGATLSSGTPGVSLLQNPDGSYTVTLPADVTNANNTPVTLVLHPPADVSGQISLTVVGVSMELETGEVAKTTVTQVPISLDAQADNATITVTTTTAAEDQALTLGLSVGVTDTTGTPETVQTVLISGLPAGYGLKTSDGPLNTTTQTSITVDGQTVTGVLVPLTALASLAVIPKENVAGTVSLTVHAVTQDGSDQALTSQVVSLTFSPVTDEATVTATTVSGTEDQAGGIALTLSGALTDTDGSEVISYTLSGLPEDALLSAGINNGNGSWTLTQDQLTGLKFYNPTNVSGSFDLTLTASTMEKATGEIVSVDKAFTVTVDAAADQPVLIVRETALATKEDTSVGVHIDTALIDTDGSETLSLIISKMPAGGSFDLGHVDLNDATRWILEADDVATLASRKASLLTFTPPPNGSGTYAMDVTLNATETSNASTASVTTALTVSVSSVVDTPSLSPVATSGNEDTAIRLDLGAALTDTDGSETLSVVVGNIPNGASLAVNGVTVYTSSSSTGSYTLNGSQLSALTLTPPKDYAGDVTLSVKAISTDSDTGTTASVSSSVTVTVAPVADTPTLTVSAASGAEDTAIALTISGGVTDSSETLSVVISGLPSGATLSAGTPNADGSYTLTPAQLSGLTLTPPDDFSGTLTLTVKAISTDGTSTAETTAPSPSPSPRWPTPHPRPSPGHGAEDSPHRP